MKKPNYAEMFTLRADGRYQGYWHEQSGPGKGKRHAICDRDPERLFRRIQEKEAEAVAPLSFDAAAEAWEREHLERIGHNTAETYKAPLRRIRDQFSGYGVEEIEAYQIQAFLNGLGKQGFSKRSVQMHRDILNMIFNAAIVSGKLRFNPVSAVKVPRGLPQKRRELPEDAAIEAVKNSADVPFSMFAMICLYAGLRRGEALALRYEDVDREAGLIHVTKAVEFVGNNPHIKPPKTEAGVRDVPLLAPLAEAIPSKESGYVFPRDDGGPLTKTQYRKRWIKYCEEIGHDITAHQLRHGYATILYEAGIGDKDKQELLGHASVVTTTNIYTHLRQAQKQKVAKKLNAFVCGNDGEKP